MKWIKFAALNEKDQLFFYKENGASFFCFPGEYPPAFTDELRLLGFLPTFRGYCAPLSYTRAESLLKLPGATQAETTIGQVQLAQTKKDPVSSGQAAPLLPLLHGLWPYLQEPHRMYVLTLDAELRAAGSQNTYSAWKNFVVHHVEQSAGFLDWINIAIHNKLQRLGWRIPQQAGIVQNWPKRKGAFEIALKETLNEQLDLPTFIFKDTMGGQYEMKLVFQTTLDMLASELDIPANLFPIKEHDDDKNYDVTRNQSAQQPLVADETSVSTGQQAGGYVEDISGTPDRTDGRARRDDAQRPSPDHGTQHARRTHGTSGRNADGSNVPVWRGEREGQPAGRDRTAEDMGMGRESSGENNSHLDMTTSVMEHTNNTNAHFSLPAEAMSYPTGLSARAQANVEAIRLLKELQKNARTPNDGEKKILAGFSGWGGLGSKVFPDLYLSYTHRQGLPAYLSENEKKKYEQWTQQFGNTLCPALGGVLSDDEWNTATTASLNAHYTDPEVVSAMWDMAKRLGFKGGIIVEPSAGTGAFLRYMPSEIAEKSSIHAVELDAVSGQILSYLHPNVHVEIGGFEKSKAIKDNTADLVISNVPFGNYKVYDPIRKSYNSQSIHNYFLSRAIDTVRPGGLVLVITSHFSLDAISGGALRANWAKKADILGAVRLPRTAFLESANTEVVADILIFRKKTAQPLDDIKAFQHTVKLEAFNEDAFRAASDSYEMINEYFIAHPNMVLGSHATTHSQYNSPKYTVEQNSTETLAEGLQRVLLELPKNTVGASTYTYDSTAPERFEQGREGSLVIDSTGFPVFIENGVSVRPSWSNNIKRVDQAKSYCALKDCLTTLIAAMNSDFDDAGVINKQKQLNHIYDSYVERYGYLTQIKRNTFLHDDLEFPNMAALEIARIEPNQDQETGESFSERVYKKSDIFSKRTIYPFHNPDTADNIDDAIKISKVFYGSINTSYIASLLHTNEEVAIQMSLQSGQAFLNPINGLIESQDLYLSGNVKAKLLEAQQATEFDMRYQQNVDALLQVQPAPRTISDIYVKLGTSWVSPNIIEDFLKDCGIIMPRVSCMRIDGINLEDGITTWSVAKNYRHVMQEMKWKIDDSVGILDLVEDCLNLRMTKVYQSVDGASGKKQIENKILSLAAQEKQRELQELFRTFIKSNRVYIETIEDTYNRLFNNYTLREFPVPDIAFFPGASQSISLRPNQKKAIARAVQESTLVAHSVGTGKTFTLISIAMEMRRLRTAKKPWIVIQGATVPQFAAAFKSLYPNAKILVPTEAQRTAENRKKLLAQIATGDWDAVITPHSFFNNISVSPAIEEKFIQESIAQYQNLFSEHRHDRKCATYLKRKTKQLQARLEKILDIKKDNNIYFEDLGIDALLIDEAHTYKRGTFETKMDNVKGLDRDSSQRSMQFLLKTQLVRAKTGGKNIILATGTPISNTLTELWTLFRYFRPELLEEFNVTQFDDFASTFAETSVALEETSTGDFRLIERFNKYVNGLDLLSMWKTGADVALAEDMPYLEGRPKLKGGKVQEVTVDRSEKLAEFIRALKSERDNWDHAPGWYKRENPSIPLEVYGKARRASIDLRLVEPSSQDEPGSKANVAVENIYQCWKATTASKSTQVLFADSFRSSDHSFNLFEDIKDKLCMRGIPAHEIAIIHDYPTDKARAELYNEVCAGAVRLIMGTTEKLGTGVNVQERLISEHNIDMPFRPMDFEQRQGRIERPGNRNPEVNVFVYGTKDTLDSVIIQQVLAKQKFINQILRGDVQTSTFENPFDDVQSSFEDLLAAFSGNPLTKEKMQLQTEIRKLETLQNVYYRHMAEVRYQKKCNLARQDGIRRNLPTDYQVQNFIQQHYPEGVTDGKKMGKAIAEWLSNAELNIQDKLEKITSYHEWIGRKEQDFLQASNFSLPGGVDATIKVEGTIRHKSFCNNLQNEIIMSYSLKAPCGIDVSGSLPTASTVLRHLEKALLTEAERPSRNEAKITQLETEDAEADVELCKPFKQADELTTLRSRLVEVEVSLANALNMDLIQVPQTTEREGELIHSASQECDFLPVTPCL